MTDRAASADLPRRVAIVGDAGFYVGPELARHLAARNHDLVLGDRFELPAFLREIAASVTVNADTL